MSQIEEGGIVQLDRWNLGIEPNKDVQGEAKDEAANEQGPLEVFNNYFSFGADAGTTLKFHESRGMPIKIIDLWKLDLSTLKPLMKKVH